MPAGSQAASPGGDKTATWTFDARLVGFERVDARNVLGYGTLNRYRAVMSDGVEREVIHGQAPARRKPPGRATDLTICTAPPLTMGTEGMMMHFLLKSMEMGVDGIIFGPEAAGRDQQASPNRLPAIASQVSLAASAHAAHEIADRLATESGSRLSHLLWVGMSLGALKGILFAAMAPSRHRTMVYSHFVTPVCPDPVPAPTDQEYRQFVWGEMGAVARATAELMWKDFGDRTFRIHEDVARLLRPGLLPRYARSMPWSRSSTLFAQAWRRAVASGEGGAAAAQLPLARLTTFELFDQDAGAPIDAWRQKLQRQIETGTTRLVICHGRHGDAARLSFQRRRTSAVRFIVDEIYAGRPVDELIHPLVAAPPSARHA